MGPILRQRLSTSAILALCMAIAGCGATRAVWEAPLPVESEARILHRAELRWQPAGERAGAALLVRAKPGAAGGFVVRDRLSVGLVGDLLAGRGPRADAVAVTMLEEDEYRGIREGAIVELRGSVAMDGMTVPAGGLVEGRSHLEGGGDPRMDRCLDGIRRIPRELFGPRTVAAWPTAFLDPRGDPIPHRELPPCLDASDVLRLRGDAAGWALTMRVLDEAGVVSDRRIPLWLVPLAGAIQGGAELALRDGRLHWVLRDSWVWRRVDRLGEGQGLPCALAEDGVRYVGTRFGEEAQMALAARILLTPLAVLVDGAKVFAITVLSD